jgi:hypothetical protein
MHIREKNQDILGALFTKIIVAFISFLILPHLDWAIGSFNLSLISLNQSLETILPHLWNILILMFIAFFCKNILSIVPILKTLNLFKFKQRIPQDTLMFLCCAVPFGMCTYCAIYLMRYLVSNLSI